MKSITKWSVAVAVVISMGNTFAAPTKDAAAGTLVFPNGNEYIVVAQDGNQVCNHLDTVYSCTMAKGKYRWRDFTAVEEGYFFAMNTAITQGALPTQYTEPAGSALPASNYGGVSVTDVQAMIDVLSVPDGVIDTRAYAVFQTNCTAQP